MRFFCCTKAPRPDSAPPAPHTTISSSPAISLAPLRGVTIREYREAYARRFGGVDYAVAPFIPTVAGDKVMPKLLKDIAPDAAARPLSGTPPPSLMPTIPQLIGKDPAQLRVMASALRGLGFTQMNLNCGCPWKFVAKKGRGSGLPEDELLFAKMLEAGCAAMPGGFSIKIRLGMKDNATLAKRAALISSFPLKEIIIHPRTGAQMYEGAVDLDEFERVLPQMKCPVVYNGDIQTPSDAERILARFPQIAGIMIGRGIIADPFLPATIKARLAASRPQIAADVAAAPAPAPATSPPPRDPAAALDFLRELYETYRATLCGPSPVLGRMKELWGFAYVYFNGGLRILRAIQRAQTLVDYESAIASLRN